MRLPELNSRYGVAIFDSIGSNHGFACIAGEEPFEIASSGDLSTDVYWITNLDVKTFHDRGLSQSPRLRADSFLRTRLSSILIELGIKHQNSKLQAKRLSELFQMVMQFAYLDVGMTDLSIGSLNNGIRQIELPKEPVHSSGVREAAYHATQPHVVCQKNLLNQDTELVSLVFHRYEYAKRICAQPLPTGDWQRVSETILNLSQHELADWVNSNLERRPMLLCIEITNVDPVVNNLINYGSGAGYQVNTSNNSKTTVFNKRRWMTSIEWAFTSKFASMKIDDIYIADGFAPSPLSIPFWGHYCIHSYAFGLYCENIWTSATRALDNKPSRSPLSAWIHSIDRIYCIQKAISLIRTHDLTIHSYGYGRILMHVSKVKKPYLNDIAMALRMIAPMNVCNERVSNRNIDKANPAQLLQLTMERNEYKFIEAVNEKALQQAIEHFRKQIIKQESGPSLVL